MGYLGKFVRLIRKKTVRKEQKCRVEKVCEDDQREEERPPKVKLRGIYPDLTEELKTIGIYPDLSGLYAANPNLDRHYWRYLYFSIC